MNIYIHIPFHFSRMFKYCCSAIASTQALPTVLFNKLEDITTHTDEKVSERKDCISTISQVFLIFHYWRTAELHLKI